MKVPGSTYFRKSERFMELHYIRGELFMEFCRDSCKEAKEMNSNLCFWCSKNRWVGNPTDRIPQPLPDPEKPGHYMDVFATLTYDRNGECRNTDDHLP